MDIKLLRTDIKSNMIPKFLIFIGEEQALARQYIDSISTTLNKYHKFYSTADEVLVETSTNLREDFLYVILNDTSILKNPNYISSLIATNRNIIVYFTNPVDDLFIKANKEYIVDFKKIDKYSIVAYLMQKLHSEKIEVAQEKIETLVDYCNCDFGICLNELDKVISLGQASANYLTDYMLSNGFSDYRQTNLFSFVQKILYGKVSAFDDAQRIGDSIISIITVLYNQARLKLVETNDERYGSIMTLCDKLDSGIKDGSIDTNSTLKYLLLKVIGG